MRRCLVYLADLIHVSPFGMKEPTVPLACGLMAAYAHARYGQDIETRIFKDAEELTQAIKERPPDIIGLSCYHWNYHLSKAIVRFAKSVDGRIVCALGGPSIDDDRESIGSVLRDTGADFVIPLEGEEPFSQLIGSYLGGTMSAGPIPGCYNDVALALLPVGSTVQAVSVRDLNDIPSPYLGGYFDRFLADPRFIPLVQTMRGCPYLCDFCVAGGDNWKTLRSFQLERVKEEIAYIDAHSENKYLIIADENFGILPRDSDLAAFILQHHERTGHPFPLYFYNAKQITGRVRELIKSLYKLGTYGFGMSVQSLTQPALQAVRRVNMSLPTIVDHAKWARDNGMRITTEVIFGFPHETRESFVQTLSTLENIGFTGIQIYNLLLLKGVDISRKEYRDKYQIVTKFRLPDRAYGQYSEFRELEEEEVVVSTLSFSFEDYLYVREFALIHHLIYGLHHYEDVVRHLMNYGVNGSQVIARVVDELTQGADGVLLQFRHDARQELFDTHEEMREHYFRQWDRDGIAQMAPIKLNILYGASLIYHQAFGEPDTFRHALLKVVRTVDREQELNLGEDFYDQFETLCRSYASRRIDVFNLADGSVEEYDYDLAGWAREGYARTLSEYRTKSALTYICTAKPVIARFVERNHGLRADHFYHNLLMEVVPTAHLLYEVHATEGTARSLGIARDRAAV